MDNGKIIKCMDRENLNGQMEGHIKETMLTIKSMVKESIHGLMVECIKEGFIMVNSTEKEYIGKRLVKKFTVYGKKEKKVKYAKTMTNF